MKTEGRTMEIEGQATRLPSMGEGVQEAVVSRWLKSVGDKVVQGEAILDVSTDKVDTEISATQGGYLVAQYVHPEQTIQVGDAVAWIADVMSDDHPPQPSNLHHSQPATGAGRKNKKEPSSRDVGRIASSVRIPGSYAGPVRATPLARRLAKDEGVALSDIIGSGPEGRIVRDDILLHLQDSSSGGPQLYRAEVERLKVDRIDGDEYLNGVKIRREEMSRVRRLTAEHMVHSEKIAPHVTTTFEMDLEAVRIQRSKSPIKVTWTAWFLKAAAVALKKREDLNAAVDGTDILYYDEIRLGCAVATPQGLVVPVIQKADELTLEEMSQTLNDLAQRARDGGLKSHETQGGTFTVTNPGMFGSLHSQPILNQPQVGILSIGTITQKPVVVDNQIVIHPTCQMGVTFDHRAVDGEGGAKFLAAMRDALLNPNSLM
ncbi:MAG: dihydrolipoamide acetyltransferase family protein [Oligoflexales bacterium]